MILLFPLIHYNWSRFVKIYNGVHICGSMNFLGLQQEKTITHICNAYLCNIFVLKYICKTEKTNNNT